MPESNHSEEGQYRSTRDYGLQGLHRWNTEFTKRHDLSFEIYSVPFVARSQTYNSIEKDNIIKVFMEVEGNMNHWSSQARQVVGFCEKGASTNESQAAIDGSDEKVAFLDERDGVGNPRSGQHALTSVELLERLMNPVRYIRWEACCREG